MTSSSGHTTILQIFRKKISLHKQSVASKNPTRELRFEISSKFVEERGGANANSLIRKENVWLARKLGLGNREPMELDDLSEETRVEVTWEEDTSDFVPIESLLQHLFFSKNRYQTPMCSYPHGLTYPHGCHRPSPFLFFPSSLQFHFTFSQIKRGEKRVLRGSAACFAFPRNVSFESTKLSAEWKLHLAGFSGQRREERRGEETSRDTQALGRNLRD